MAPSVTLFGPLDTVLGGSMEPILLVLAVVNLVTRGLGHRRHVKQAEEGAEAIGRHPAHVASSILLVLAAFYYTTLAAHSGIVVSVLVVGMFIADFFELEARRVEARRGIEIERPKGAIGASVFVLLYTGYLALFFLIEPIWSAVV